MVRHQRVPCTFHYLVHLEHFFFEIFFIRDRYARIEGAHPAPLRVSPLRSIFFVAGVRIIDLAERAEMMTFNELTGENTFTLLSIPPYITHNAVAVEYVSGVDDQNYAGW